MNKTGLIEQVAAKEGLPKEVAALIVDTVFDSLASALDAGQGVEIRGFGSFRMKVRGATIRRNPKTGAKVQVGEKRVAVFRVGRELREAVNGGMAAVG